MSAITKIEAGNRSGLWRWDGVDADHGFPIVGYIVSISEGLVLVDPPGTSGTAAEIRALGHPYAIALTNQWHVRGSAKWAREFGIPIAGPASARSELSEAGGELDQVLYDGERQLGWQIFHLQAAGNGSYSYDELAYWEASSGTLIIGDLLSANEQGEIGLGPVQFAGVPAERLRPALERLSALQPRLLLSAHLGPRTDGAQLLSQALQGI